MKYTANSNSKPNHTFICLWYPILGESNKHTTPNSKRQAKFMHPIGSEQLARVARVRVLPPFQFKVQASKVNATLFRNRSAWFSPDSQY